MSSPTSNERQPMSDEERRQIRMMLRFLLFVLIAIAIAAVSVGILVSLVNTTGNPVP